MADTNQHSSTGATLQEKTMSEMTAKHSSPLSIALAWLIVLIPSAWGVYLTAQRAANLFK